MTAARCCPHTPCPGPPRWRIERVGDASVSWSCREHLGQETERLRRDLRRGIDEFRLTPMPRGVAA